ncbi:hypothetical protein J4221_06140 [Candidatus Pacearchaeota archaeon]|nr:hypothetical protein [Candidatus Pacearchaeota archaeon]
MKNKITTIKISKETKERLDGLKEYNRESYDEILRKILFILNYTKKDPEKAHNILIKIDANIKRNERMQKSGEYTEDEK